MIYGICNSGAIFLVVKFPASIVIWSQGDELEFVQVHCGSLESRNRDHGFVQIKTKDRSHLDK